jgi:DNA-binding CsgD family transcriptional regulator
MTDLFDGAPHHRTLEAYASLVEHLGRTSFESALSSALTSIAPWTRYYLFGNRGPQAGSLHLSRCEAGIERLIPLYQERYLPHDPLQALLQADGAGAQTILLQLPTSEAPLEYRRLFLDRHRILERVTVVHRLGERCFGLSISRHQDQGYCSNSEMKALADLGRLIGPLLHKHRELNVLGHGGKCNITEYERRFAESYPELPYRERQVCARAASGMSLEATSIDMRVAVSSVVTYRRRAYRRLSIGSANELSHLIMR